MDGQQQGRVVQHRLHSLEIHNDIIIYFDFHYFVMAQMLLEHQSNRHVKIEIQNIKEKKLCKKEINIYLYKSKEEQLNLTDKSTTTKYTLVIDFKEIAWLLQVPSS